MPHTFITPYFQWLQDTGISTYIREDAFWYPFIIALHVMGNATGVGLILALDFRLLGWGMKKTPVSALFNQLRPWAIVGISYQMITGLILFVGEPMKCYDSRSYWIKMAAMFLALGNAFLFDKTVYPGVSKWDTLVKLPGRARWAGGSSLVLWAVVIYFGRWLAYS